MDLLTAGEMRAAEQLAIGSGAVSGLELMERAGQGVVDAIGCHWPDLAPGRMAVLCGPGNNGGDGFVIARLLADRGWAVDVFLLGQSDRLPPDAARNYQRWSAMGAVHPLGDLRDMSGFDLVIDALFGTGLTRGFAGLQGAAIGAPVVAVDIPSGICADSGRVLEQTIPADLTVTFHQPKLGHYLADGPRNVGHLVVCDIGLEPTRGTGLITADDAMRGQVLKSDGHKFSHGSALVLSGSFGRTGASRLAARAALRIGAGLVTLGAPGAAMAEIAAQITALMLRVVSDASDLQDILQDTRINTLCLGPALGLDRARDLVGVALGSGRSVVLDADALSAFRDDPDALLGQLHPGCVLTPHGGEFARLFPDLAAKLAAPTTSGPAYSKRDATRDAAKRAGCVVLFKGVDTVIAGPDGTCRIHSASGARSVPWLATAGAGDVLAGIITGLLARGINPMEAASYGAWLHVETARMFGPGLIAEDLPEQIPNVLKSLADGNL